MEERKKNIQYTAEDIRKYLNGELTTPEMQALEKAALEDPFLSDAIEGFQESLTQPVSFESGMEELNKKLNERITTGSSKKRSGFLLLNWRVAASVVLIAGTAALTITYINSKNTKSDLARIIKRDSGDEKTQPAAAPAANEEKTRTSQYLNEDSPSTAIHDQVQLHKKSSQNIEPISNKNKNADHSDKESAKAETEKSLSDSSGIDAGEVPVTASASREVKRSFAPKIAADQLKAGVSGLSVKDSSRNPNPTAETKLNEVTVIGYGTSSKKDITGSTTVIVTGNNNNIEPENGWEAYYNYLKNKKQIPPADSLLKGEETISFIVHANGKLSSFKIEKSVSTVHDAELIRLVKEGPVWKITGVKKQRCRLTFNFE